MAENSTTEIVIPAEVWEAAERHLSEIEKAYAAIGTTGYFGLNTVIRPVRDRYNNGERTKKLYDDIMALE